MAGGGSYAPDAESGDRPQGRSIAEAIAVLAAEFPGLRAETLRAMERHGLLAPARTAAGYRRYSDRDLETVREILGGAPAEHASAVDARPAGAEAAAVTAPRRPARYEPGLQSASPASDSARNPYRSGTLTDSQGESRTSRTGSESGRGVPAARPSRRPAVPPPSAPAPAAPAAPARTPAQSREELADPGASGARRRAQRWPEPEYFTPELGEMALDREGLARAAGLAEEWVAELAGFGLISGRDPASGADLLVARAAADLLGYGIEPRHLRPVAVAAGRAAELIRAAHSGSSRSAAAQAAAALVRLEAALLRAALLDD